MELTEWTRYILKRRREKRHERTTEFLESQGYKISQTGYGFDAVLVATHKAKPSYSSKVYETGGHGQVPRMWTPV